MDISTCDYRSIIKNYSSLNIPDEEITRYRLQYLYDLYYLCDDKNIKIKFIKHIENILLTRFGMSISLVRNIDKTVDLGYNTIAECNDSKFLGEILPILLVLEKEFIFIKDNRVDSNDNIENWMISYLSKYDKLKLTKENNDVYDIFNAYATRVKKAKVIASIIKVKINAAISNVVKKIK